MDGVDATRTFDDVKLSEGEESELVLAVPQNLASMSFSLEAKVEVSHTGAK